MVGVTAARREVAKTIHVGSSEAEGPRCPVIRRPASAVSRAVPGHPARKTATDAAMRCESVGRRGSGRCGGWGEPGHRPCHCTVRLPGRGRPAPAGRQLPAGAPLLHRGGHPAYQDDKCRDHDGKGQEKQQASPAMMGAGAEAIGIRIIDDVAGVRDCGRDDQQAARLDGGPCQRPAACQGGRARHPGPGPDGRGGRVIQPGRARDVGGDCVQLGVSSRGEHLARSCVEFVPGQPALRERVLQRVDHMLAVGVARPEAAKARCCRVLRSCDHRHTSPSTMPR